MDGVEVLLLLPIDAVNEGLGAVANDAAAAAPVVTDGVEVVLVLNIGALSAGWEEDISTSILS